MSRLEKMIQEFCPDGVEYKPLNAIAHYAKKRIDASLVDENTYVGVENLLQNKQGKAAATSVPKIGVVIAFEKDDILIGNIRPYLRKIWLADSNGGTNGDVLAIQIENKAELLPKFLYYVLSSESFFTFDIQNSKGAKMPRGSKDAVMNYAVPMPPLEVQREIVRILDKFKELTAELTSELSARRQQYEYYSNKLLAIDAPQHSLESLCDIVDYRGKTPRKVDSGVFLVTAKNIRKGYIDYEKSQEFIDAEDYNNVMRRGLPEIGDVLITTEAPCGNVAQIDRENIALAQRVIKYRPKTPALKSTYLKHVLLGAEFQNKLLSAATGGTVKGIKGSRLHQLTIPVPSIEEQEYIISILDCFDTICNSPTSGLPAEIEARQKQYEYYRDKLLTFKEKAIS